MPATNTLLSNEGVTQEGGDMDVYVFMSSEETMEGTVYKMVETSLFNNPDEQDGYWRSLINHQVVNNVLAIPQGTYRHRLMEEMALRRGLHFRAVSYETKALEFLNYTRMTQKATLTYSTAERATFMSILKTNKKFFTQEDVLTSFGAKALGIGLKNTKKLMKRTQEFLRSTHMSLFYGNAEDTIMTTTGGLRTLAEFTDTPIGELFTDNKLVIAQFTRPEWVVAKFGEAVAKVLYDGANMIDMEVVLNTLRDAYAHVGVGTLKQRRQRRRIIRTMREMRKLAKSGVPFVGRYNGRILTGKGLIKGDFIAVVGLKLRTGADVVFDAENLKDEIWTLEGETIIALEVHEALHPDVKWDRQSTTNFRYGLTEVQEGADILAMEQAALDIIEGKEIPPWMILRSEEHNGMSGFDYDTTKELANQDFHRWQQYGMDVFAAQNYGSVWLGGMVRRMETFLNKETGFNKKPFIPMSHVVSMGVMTYRAVEDMALIKLDNLDQTKVNAVANVGALIPTSRWIDTLDLHGGQDLDDTNNIHIRRVYCSNAEHLANLVDDGVISLSAAAYVPKTAEEARQMGLFIRQPNGAGEYSIEVLSEYFVDDVKEDAEREDILNGDAPLLDLAKMPRGITFLRTQADQVELDEDPELVYGGEYTREDAQYAVEAQAGNPSIGQVANMLMVWHEALGSILPVGIPSLEAMVDTVQQTRDKVAISQVAAVPALIGQQLAEKLEANPNLKVDKLFVTERLRYTKGEFMEIIRERMDRRRPTKTNSVYNAAIRAIRKLIKERLLQMRAETDLYKAIRGIRFSDRFMGFAEAHVDDMRYRFDTAARDLQIDPYDSPFLKVAKRMELTEAIRAIVEEKVGILTAQGDEMKYYITAMYRYIIQPQRGPGGDWLLGTYDQVLFRSAGADVALFDLLGQVVRDNNLIK